MRRLPLSLCLVVATLGCGGTDNPTPTADASMTADTADTAVMDDLPTPDVARDVATDTADAALRPLYSPCTSRSQCMGGTVASCLTTTDGYPGGLCSRSCSSDADCDGGICYSLTAGMRCIPSCTTPSECRDGYQCQGIVGRDDRACFPWCSTNADCMPSSCNMWTRRCGSSGDTTRADNGGACAVSTQCRSGRCSTELNDMMMPTGYLDGICFSLCTIPPDSEYAGTRVPQGNCPMGSVCVRDTNGMAGGIGYCRVQCMTSDDCRPGYICSRPRRPGADAGTYDNGYCAPMNCHFGTQMCPSFASCRTTVTDDAGVATSGFCVRNDDGGIGDASADVTATSLPTARCAAHDACER